MNQIQKIIDEIESVDLSKDDAVGKLKFIFSTKLRELPAIIISDLVAGESLVRSRPLEQGEEYHYDVQDYSYNPIPGISKIGRANFAGQQIFYGSRFRITSLKEVRFIYSLRTNKSGNYSLGRWEVKKDLLVAAIVDPELIKKHNANELINLAAYIENVEKKMLGDPEFAKYVEIYHYMAKKFTEPVVEGEEEKYKITAVFSDFIFSKLPMVDGILYQSVQHPEHYNVALKKEVVDSGKVQLTFAARQSFKTTISNDIEEELSIETYDIDYQNKKVNWKPKN